jgi:hypothetical protein
MSRLRPLLAVRLTGPADFRVRDALLDTGSDETIFAEDLAPRIGVDLDQAEEPFPGVRLSPGQ